MQPYVELASSANVDCDKSAIKPQPSAKLYAGLLLTCFGCLVIGSCIGHSFQGLPVRTAGGTFLPGEQVQTSSGGSPVLLNATGLAPEGILGWLRSQDFNKKTETALLEHAVVKAAESGNLTLTAVRLVLLEEYWIEQSDLRSMAAALARFGGGPASRSFFLSSANAENTALEDLLKMARILGISQTELSSYQPMPAAHAYSAYLAQLSSYGGQAAMAAGFAVNFPTWGRMCERIRDALRRAPYEFTKEAVQFFTDFAEPIPGFDESATAVIAEGMANGETAESIKSSVMLLQGYEVMFWDAIWAKATT